MVMSWNGQTIADLSREFLNTNGAVKHTEVAVTEKDLSALSKDGRPISQSRDLSELFAERLPKYRAVADHEINCGNDVKENCATILEIFGK